jgi:hypothetical protein
MPQVSKAQEYRVREEECRRKAEECSTAIEKEYGARCLRNGSEWRGTPIPGVNRTRDHDRCSAADALGVCCRSVQERRPS